MSLSGVHSPGRSLHGYNKRLSQLVMVGFIIGYWLFVWGLERIDYTQSPPQWLQTVVGNYPLFDVATPIVVFLAEIFSPRVLRHFIPVIVGWWLARQVVVRFLESFYDFPDRAAAASLLSRLVAGHAAGEPAATIDRERFDEDRQQNSILRVGGPGGIVVGRGDAVVTERNGRFYRVLGPGFHSLGRFEYPAAVVDVRPQERSTEEAQTVTADGISLSTELSVAFQIDPGSEAPSKRQSFPFDEDAVYLAAYGKTSLGDGQIGHWDSLPLGATAGQLAALVGEYQLDELVFSDQTGIRARQNLKREMERRARAIMRRFGVLIRDTRLGSFRLPDEVHNQRVNYWRAYWETEGRVRLTVGEARAKDTKEIARAQAEAMMIQALVEGLDRAQRLRQNVSTKEIVALRLIEALEAVAQQSQGDVALPENLLPTLGSIRQEIVTDDEAVTDLLE